MAWKGSTARVYEQTFENIRKRSKTFENIRKRSKNDVKRLKIFENIRLFCRRLRKWSRRKCSAFSAGKW